jgi:formylglycine-generating enzyme required for sulfatase activity
VRRTEPRFWRDEQLNNPAQPVVGITWYEARAYSLWLAAQTGRPWRLPRDLELEAAARGPGGREYPYGAPFSPLGGNTVATLLRRTTPVGVFIAGDTPAGLTDMSGNAESYSSTLAEPPGGWRQPSRRRYVPALDDLRAPDTSERVLRGGSWRDNHTRAHPAYGVSEAPDTCPDTSGLRLALGVDAAV